MTDSEGERRIGLMVRLPADVHAEVVRVSKGGARLPSTSLNNTVVFLLRLGLAALKRSEQSENDLGPLELEQLAA